jgi:hypothetical protein
MPNACIVYLCTVYGRILYVSILIWICFTFAYKCLLCIAFSVRYQLLLIIQKYKNMCTVRVHEQKILFLIISVYRIPPLIRCQNIHISAICCFFKNSKFYIAEHKLYGYRYISLVKKEWLHALEKSNQTILNTVVETLLLFFLFMHCKELM